MRSPRVFREDRAAHVCVAMYNLDVILGELVHNSYTFQSIMTV